MRIQPVMSAYNNFNKTRKQQTQFEAKNDFSSNHKYIGVASADLAYASLVNKSIANDLKKMGLI